MSKFEAASGVSTSPGRDGTAAAVRHGPADDADGDERDDSDDEQENRLDEEVDPQVHCQTVFHLRRG
jgi:hypothetical protein